MIESFKNYKNNQINESTTTVDENNAVDWWTSLPDILKSIGYFVNKIKSKITNDDIVELRLLYGKLNGTYKSNKENKNISEVQKEKQLLKDLLKTLNDLGEKTGLYCGIIKSRPKQNRGPYVRMEGRWITIYKFTYGNDKMYINYLF